MTANAARRQQASGHGGLDEDAVFVWRHPRAIGAEGRCIGHTHLAIDPRKAKRLARRIQYFARQHRLPKVVLTSPLQRSRAVGEWLARWGWSHRVDPALAEANFGRWDGLCWADVPQAEIDAWCRDFLHYPPGGGECVHAVLQRVRCWRPGEARIAVGHGGWLSAARWLATQGWVEPRSEVWPAAPAHGQRTRLQVKGWLSPDSAGLAPTSRTANPCSQRP